MKMCNKIFEMVRGTGHAGVTGVDLARAMPGVLATNIREALSVLEEDNNLMVDGPLGGLEGVTVYEIETDKRVTQGKGGGKSARMEIKSEQVIRFLGG